MNLYAIATALSGAISYRKLRYYLSRGYYATEQAEEFAAAAALGFDPAKAGEIGATAALDGSYAKSVVLGGQRYTATLTVEGE